jgi:hypothetical protein
MSHVERRGLSFLRDWLRLVAMMSSPHQSPALDYAPHTPQHRRHAAMRLWTRRIVWCALATVVVAIGWRLAKQAWYLHRQDQLMGHSKPFGPLEEDTTKKMGGRVLWPAAADLLPVSINFPVFIHERVTKDGISRLIVVQEASVADNIALTPFLHTSIFEPAGFLPGSRLKLRAGWSMAHPRMRIVRSAIDPNDSSHFTIDYELNGEKGIIDGWLLSEGSATLEPRDGPLKNPSLPAETPDKGTPSSTPT